MNIQDSIVKIIAALQEAGVGLTRKQLQEMLSAAGNNMDWTPICDRALEVGLLKIKNQRARTLTYTPEGKKFCKKPYPVSLSGEKPQRPAAPSVGDGLDEDLLLVMRGTADSRGQQVTSARSRLQLKLIRAIDRKIALDDFAESENIDLDEVLDNLEDLRNHGKHLDITYFVNEVIGQDNVDEVRDSFDGSPFDMDAIISEWGDVYNDEELRLLGFILLEK